MQASSLPLFRCPRSAALCTCWSPTWNLVCPGYSLFLASRLLCRTFLFKDSPGPSVQVPSRIHREPFFAFNLRLKTFFLKLVDAGKGSC